MDRRILFRAKRLAGREWVEGLPGYDINGDITEFQVYRGFASCDVVEIDPGTLCRRADGMDGLEVWEGDVCSWVDAAYGTCTGVVRFGEWVQDGSEGEYPGSKCFGWHLKVVKVRSLPWDDSWSDEETEAAYPWYRRSVSLVDDVYRRDFAVIGNIFDNPGLLDGLGDGKEGQDE